jgi:hypothetical protein
VDAEALALFNDITSFWLPVEEWSPRIESVSWVEVVIARSEVPRSAGKQSHRWDRPALNAGLPVIRHPGLRSGGSAGVPAGFGATGTEAGPTKFPRMREQQRVGRPSHRRLIRCARNDNLRPTRPMAYTRCKIVLDRGCAESYAQCTEKTRLLSNMTTLVPFGGLVGDQAATVF